MKSSAIALLCAIAFGPSATAQTLVRTIQNVPMWSIAVGGDFDGDGYADVIAGDSKDSTGAASGGAVRILSGKHIATGNGGPVMATFFNPTANDHFGHAVAWLQGSLFVVGAPGPAVGAGTVYLCSVNSTGTLVTLVDAKGGSSISEQLGTSLAVLGAWEGPNFPSVAVGAPGTTSNNSAGMVRVFRLGFALFPNPHYVLSQTHVISDGFPGSCFGQSVAAADFGDLLGNGTNRELVVGAPNSPSPFPPYPSTAGTLRVFACAPGSGVATPVTVIAGDSNNKHVGVSLDAGGDITGDGVPDVVAGSGDIATGWGAHEGLALYSAGGVSSGQGLAFLARIPTGQNSSGFEMCPRVVPDLNFDGEDDLLCGAADHGLWTSGSETGTAFVFSGETRERMLLCTLPQTSHQHSGSAVAHYPGGLLLIGSGDYASSNPLYVLSLFPVLPHTYCTDKLNSQGCYPQLSTSGSPDSNSAAPFDVVGNNVINQKFGLLFYGFAPASTAFQGGWLCVAPPTQRTPVQSSGGSGSGTDCTGQFHYDFNARIQSGVDPSLVVGQEVFCQYWSRDPASPSTTSLTNGVQFVVDP